MLYWLFPMFFLSERFVDSCLDLFGPDVESSSEQSEFLLIMDQTVDDMLNMNQRLRQRERRSFILTVHDAKLN